MWDGQMIEYYSAIKNYEVQTPVTTWTNLEPLSHVKEVSHKGPHIILIPLTQDRQIHEDRKWIGCCLGGRLGPAGGDWVATANGDRFPFCSAKMF